MRSAAQLVSAAMFAGVFGLFLYKIVARYLAGNEAAWTDELSVILFIWIIFWANSLVLGEKDHITFDLIYRPAPLAAKRAMALLRVTLIGGIFLWALPGSLGYLLFLRRERTPVLEWRLDAVYSCFGLFMIAVVLRCAWQFSQLLGRGWRAHL